MVNYDISGSTMPVYVGKSGFADAQWMLRRVASIIQREIMDEEMGPVLAVTMLATLTISTFSW